MPAAPSKSAQTAIIALTYAAIISAAIAWSATKTHQTLYDRFVTNVEGLLVAVPDPLVASDFYRDVLNFPYAPLERPKNPLDETFFIPGGRKLELMEGSAAPIEVVLRVRNGFERLRTELVMRAAVFSEKRPATVGASVSEITSQPYGEEFTVRDPAGNRFVFYRPKRRSVSRFGRG